jgi:hypothetical protein
VEEKAARNTIMVCPSGEFSFGVLFGQSACASQNLCTIPPFLEDLLSGSDFGRDRLVRVQSWLRWHGEICRLSDDL